MAPLRRPLLAAAVGSAALAASLLGPSPAAVSTERPWTPQLVRVDADPDLAIAAMRRSLIIEASAALAILALVAWFGTLEPFVTADPV